MHLMKWEVPYLCAKPSRRNPDANSWQMIGRRMTSSYLCCHTASFFCNLRLNLLPFLRCSKMLLHFFTSKELFTNLRKATISCVMFV